MKKLLQKFSTPLEKGAWSPWENKCSEFIKKHPDFFCISLLVFACLLFLFFGLNFYPLIDVDETRYAVIARDLAYSFNWNNLNLNLVPFLEKPPLYFWIVGASIKFFGEFTALAVRLPIAMLSTFLVFFTYYVGKRVLSRKFGLISALVLLSSFIFLVLSHIAILDMVLTVFVTSAIYCAFLTHFCQDKNKKYYWWYFYLFVGLGFLAKGILALIIPTAVILIYNLITKTAKDIFKPVNMLPGLVIFLIITLPWHIIMYQQYGFEFIKQYFLVHHFARFLNSESIGRERPFYYFVPVFLIGFFPWTLIFIAFICNGFKKMVTKYKETQGKVLDKIYALFETTTNEQKLLVFSSVYFVVVFLLFSFSSTKLPTYILPVFPAAAFLTGYYWWVSDEKNENEVGISVTTQMFSALFIATAFIAMVGYYFLPYDLQLGLDGFKHATIITIYLLSIFLLLRLNTKRALSVFSGYILIMLFISVLSVSNIFNFLYSTGENELVQYSRIAESMDTPLITFDFAVKPSTMVDYTNRSVIFLTDPDFELLGKLVKGSLGPTFVIVKNKNMNDDVAYRKKINSMLNLLETGSKYSLYSNQNLRPYNDESFMIGRYSYFTRLSRPKTMGKYSSK